MEVYEIRPLYYVSDEELNSRLEKLQEQGLTKEELAETQEGKEAAYRALTFDEILAAYKRSQAAGIDPFETPEYQERIRRRNIDDNEAYAQMFRERFGGKE